jgi:hypothetical protein
MALPSKLTNPALIHTKPGLSILRRKKMFNMYDGYHFFGMHMLWWFFWIVFIGVIFGAYEPVRRNRRGTDDISLPRKSDPRKGGVK